MEGQELFPLFVIVTLFVFVILGMLAFKLAVWAFKKIHRLLIILVIALAIMMSLPIIQVLILER